VGHPVEFPRCKYKINIPSVSSTDVFGPGFEILFDLGHELVGDGAVNQAVVVTEGKVNDGSDGDGVVALFVGDDERHFGDAADAHDGGVGLIDDGQPEDGSELARVGNGEGRAFDVIRLELLGAGALAEVGDAALQPEEVEVAGVFEDRNDESPVERDRGGSGHCRLRCWR